MQRIFEKQTEQKIMPKGQWQELRFVCREYRGLEVLCARIAKGGNTLLGLRGEALSRLRAAAIAQLRGVSPLSTGTICNGDRAFKQLRCNPFGETT